MKTFREQLKSILISCRANAIGNSILGNNGVFHEDTDYYLDLLLQAVEDYFKQTGKQGGDSTKKNNPDHFKEIGKKGAAKRWGK